MRLVQNEKFKNIKLVFNEDGSKDIEKILDEHTFDLVIGSDGASS